MRIWVWRMTKYGVCITSAMRRLCVGQVVGPLGVVFLAASGAQAGAWEEFETRCLVPMENVEAPISSNLEFVPPPNPDSPSDVFVLTAEVYFYVSGVLGDQSVGCGMGADAGESTDKILVRGLKHMNALVDAKRYTPMNGENYDFGFQSTEWREPRLNVFFNTRNDTFAVSVEETDLES